MARIQEFILEGALYWRGIGGRLGPWWVQDSAQLEGGDGVLLRLLAIRNNDHNDCM